MSLLNSTQMVLSKIEKLKSQGEGLAKSVSMKADELGEAYLKVQKMDAWNAEALVTLKLDYFSELLEELELTLQDTSLQRANLKTTVLKSVEKSISSLIGPLVMRVERLEAQSGQTKDLELDVPANTKVLVHPEDSHDESCCQMIEQNPNIMSEEKTNEVSDGTKMVTDEFDEKNTCMIEEKGGVIVNSSTDQKPLVQESLVGFGAQKEKKLDAAEDKSSSLVNISSFDKVSLDVCNLSSGVDELKANLTMLTADTEKFKQELKDVVQTNEKRLEDFRKELQMEFTKINKELVSLKATVDSYGEAFGNTSTKYGIKCLLPPKRKVTWVRYDLADWIYPFIKSEYPEYAVQVFNECIGPFCSNIHELQRFPGAAQLQIDECAARVAPRRK